MAGEVPRLSREVTGRTDDMMIVRGVNVFPSQVEEPILTVEGLSPHYLCVLTRPSTLDELTVRVEVLPPGSLERSLGKARRISDERRAARA